MPLSRRRRSLLPAALLMLAALVVGCSSGEQDGPDPDESSPGSTGLPDQAFGSDDADEAAVDDPCDLLGPDDFDRLVEKDLRPKVIELPELDSDVGAGDHVWFQCTITANGLPVLSWGYALDDGAYAAARDQYDPGRGAGSSDPTAQEFLEVRRIPIDSVVGEPAFIGEDANGLQAFAHLADADFRVSIGVDGATGDGNDLAEVLRREVEAGRAGVERTAIDVGEGCPSATDPKVEAVLGTVGYARGGTFQHGIPTCTYLDEDLTTLLEARLTYANDSVYRSETRGLLDGERALDRGPGDERSIYSGPSGTYAYYAEFDEQRILYQVDTAAVPGGGRPKGSEQAVRRLGASFLRSIEQDVRAYRYLSDGRQAPGVNG